MLKKLALAASFVYCCSLSAVPNYFDIDDEEMIAERINPGPVEKTIPSSIENVPGYSELLVASKSFRNNETNTIDAVALEYRANLMHELTTFLDQRYPRTYTRRTFFGGVSEIEYISGNNLIRVIKTFSGHTILLNGTIQWFNAYDKSRRQLKEIQNMRRENLERMRRAKFGQMKPEKRRFEMPGQRDHRDFDHRDFRGDGHPHFKHDSQRFKEHEHPHFKNEVAPEFKDPRPHHPKPEMHREHPRDVFEDSFSLFDDIFSDDFFDDEFFKEDSRPMKPMKKKPMMKEDSGKNVKTYNFSQTYSNVDGIEELKRNDNGDVTEVMKTPEKITVTHNGVTKNISPEDLKAAGNVVNLAKQLDPNCEIEVVFVDDNAKTPAKGPKKCCCPPKEHRNFPLRSAEDRAQDPRVKYCMPPAAENFAPKAPENDVMLYVEAE